MKSAVTLELTGECKVPAFRPFLWSLITKTSLGGWISNSVDGVQLRLEGDDLDITLFLRSFPDKISRWFRLKSIRLLKKESLPETAQPGPFRLVGPVFYDGLIQPDRAPCASCKEKMLDPASRFYRYPFLICNDCGPRYSAALLAGDGRETTAFRTFPQCKTCENEPETHPLLSCPDCGPSVFLITGDGDFVPSEDPIAAAASALKEGKIVAVKNYDGFVILCDPDHPEALRRLRERKRQFDKPISLYVNHLDTVKKYCECSPEEEALLDSPFVPVVLFRLKKDASLDTGALCPDHPGTIGLQFPPTGLIHLLMHGSPDGNGGFVPFEKLAFSGGPVPVNPEDAGGDEDLDEVCRISDLILMHDLKIWHNGGPSVQTIHPELGLRTIRRSCGIAPLPLLLRRPLKRVILALGADSCATVALGFKNKIIASHQIGNIQSERNESSLSLTAEQLALMFARIPEMIVCDMDSSSHSARMGEALSGRYRIPLITVQRHHANALACMVEHQLHDSLALVWDAGAHGLDGSIWGAELLEINPGVFRRMATFSPVQMNWSGSRLPRPVQLLSRYLKQCGIDSSSVQTESGDIPHKAYQDFLRSGDQLELTGCHSALALFDAVSAAVGLASPVRNYDQQEILRSENMLARGFDPGTAERLKQEFPFRLQEKDILFVDWTPFFQRAEHFPRLRKEAQGNLAAAFLMSAAEAALGMVQYGAARSKCRTVILSGRAFLSPTLTFFVKNKLESAGFKVCCHIQTSPDESSVSIGQALAGGMT